MHIHTHAHAHTHTHTYPAIITLLFPLSGNRCVSVNAATMALIDAGIPMKDYVCACSASYIQDTPMLGTAAGSPAGLGCVVPKK